MAKYIAREYVSGHWEIVENDTGARIATVDRCYGDVAQLFAAAPEMLEALKGTTACRGCDPPPGEACEHVIAVEAVIARIA